MQELHIDKFDALLSLAAAECVKEEAAAFLSADVSQIEDNPKMLKNILGMSRKRKWKTVKMIVLVALLCMSIAFTACMLVPEIRNAVWNVLVKHHGDHVEIEFDTGETEEATEPPVLEYPETIEQKMVLNYVPEGCVKGTEIELPTQYQMYYFTDEGFEKFIAIQSIVDGTNTFTNNESEPIVYIQIHSYKAVLIEQEEENPVLTLTWQDNRYRYSISGRFSSINEIVKIAESIYEIE